MTDGADYKPRFSFEISEEQMLRANKHLAQYGLRKAIFGKVLDEVLDLIETHGGIAIGILMTPKIKVKDILPSMRDVTAVTKKTKRGKDNG
jgi:hypothetical protein